MNIWAHLPARRAGRPGYRSNSSQTALRFAPVFPLYPLRGSVFRTALFKGKPASSPQPGCRTWVIPFLDRPGPKIVGFSVKLCIGYFTKRIRNYGEKLKGVYTVRQGSCMYVSSRTPQNSTHTQNSTRARVEKIQAKRWALNKARESVFRENRQHSGSPIEVAVRMKDKGA
jgi:hypothetical protein